MQALFPLLLLFYPLALHIGIYSGNIQLALYYLSLLLILPFLFVVLTGSKPELKHTIPLLLATVLVSFIRGNETLIVKLFPLIVNGVLLWYFATSLMAERTPLITRLASLMRDDMPEAVLIYTRHATIAWSFYFFFMLIASFLLSLYASIEIWSLFSNVLSYVFLVLMFVAEFTVRRIRVREHMDYSFSEFLTRVRKINFIRVLRR